MSRKSSLNLARLLSSLDWARNGVCVHVTLTYRHEWPRTKEALAAAKSNLTRELGRIVAVFCGIWRLEYQKREADIVPHWHCLVWLSGAAEAFERALRTWWRAESGNNHVRGVKITSGDQVRGVWYLAMHAAKREQAPSIEVGRWWGYIRRDRVLSAQDVCDGGQVEERERVWCARLMRRATGRKARDGFSWFLPRPWQYTVEQWARQRVQDERSARERPPF